MATIVDDFNLVSWAKGLQDDVSLFVHLYQGSLDLRLVTSVAGFNEANFEGYEPQKLIPDPDTTLLLATAAKIVSRMVICNRFGFAVSTNLIGGFWVSARFADGNEYVIHAEGFLQVQLVELGTKPFGLVIYLPAFQVRLPT